MNTSVGQCANALIKQITGEDEYIFNPANKVTDRLWTGFLSNRFSFWMDTSSSTLTVQSDNFLATWSISDIDVKLIQAVELGANSSSVSTLNVDSPTDSISVNVRTSKLNIDFDVTYIKGYDSVPMGNTTIKVPRGWFNTNGPVNITDDKSVRLIHAALGRPLNKEYKERLSVQLYEPNDNCKFVMVLTSRDNTESEQKRYISRDEVHDANAVIQAITDIISVE